MLHIEVDDLQGDEIAAFLQQHLDDMRATSPPESKHALDLEGLRQPDVTFWSAYFDGKLVGCAALKNLGDNLGEIKSMRTCASCRQKGVASALLNHVIEQAKSRQLERLLLETGSMAFFAPARALYGKFGFQTRGPFAQYRLDPNSVYMELPLN